jgi:quinol monooxygenase YgiN
VDSTAHATAESEVKNNNTFDTVEEHTQREGGSMRICQTAHYEVTATAVEKVKAAIVDYVDYVSHNEPGSLMYTAWQQADEPTKFVHLFTFADEAAHNVHGSSAAVKEFEAVYGHELVGGPVVFTDYRLIATNAGQ